MKIIHTADIHARRDRMDEVLASLRTIRDTADTEQVDLVVIAGDLWDHAPTATGSGRYPEVIDAIGEIADFAPIVTVYGTPSHDARGSLDILEHIDAFHGITILQPGQQYFYDSTDHCIHKERTGQSELMILGCPEPTKELLLAKGKPADSDEAIRKGMQDLLLGYCALRSENQDIPCVMVYHGTIAGATLQNGRQMPSAGIQIGRDDLALVGADYYALGHIHLAQQIGNLPAYYAGSAYPVDWGETDQKGFYLVSILSEEDLEDPKQGPGIEEGYPRFIPFPHPRRKKITIDFHDIEQNLEEYEYKGFQVWLDIRMTKEDASSSYNPEMQEKLLLKDGALPGSRVTTTIIPTETVRAGEIQEAQSLREKVQVYADASSLDYDINYLKKADELESQAKREGLTANGLHIQIDKLTLRGAIGIWKGLRQDEISIDLSTYEPGLIALIGRNGAGKSTLIENMHPYTTLLTRDGKLQEHFRLRDSYRELFFTDTRTGCKYRSYIMIDGQNKSGSVEYYLYEKNGSNWKPIASRYKEDYEAKVNDLFGSLPLYLKSAFVAQRESRANKDLSSATKGERKSIFRELAGLDYLQVYSEYARMEWKNLESDIKIEQAKIETIEEMLSSRPAKEMELKEIKQELEGISAELQKVEEAGKKEKENLEGLRKKVQRNEELRKQIDAVYKEISDLSKERHDLTGSLGEYLEAKNDREEEQKRLKEYEGLQKEKEALNEKAMQVQKERNKVLEEHSARTEAVRHEERELSKKELEFNGMVNKKKIERHSIQGKIDNLIEKTETPLDENCPTCGQKLPLEKLEQLQEERTDMKMDLKELQEKAFQLDQDVIYYERKENDFRKKREALEYPPKPELPALDEQTRLDQIEQELIFFEPEKSKEIIRKADEAEVRIEEIRKNISRIDGEIESKNKRIEEYKNAINPSFDSAFNDSEERYNELQDKYRDLRDKKVRSESQINSLYDQIAEMDRKSKELDDLNELVEGKQESVRQWQWLERACGPDGIQALELDAIAPAIAMTANDLLDKAYGARFQIEFRTTRVAGKGSKTKQVEDFQIFVHDSETGTEQEIATLSGGESVWIKKAIYDAFGIIRAKNTGTKFLTVFLDEADGALDPDAKEQYFRLLEAAHHESGRRYTIVITHSPMIQEMITQKIDMEMLSLQREPEEALV